MSKLLSLLTVLFLFGCGYEVQAQLTFADRCKSSTFFAQLFAERCDPFLSKADCIVGAWSRWSSTVKGSDGKCSQSRTRKIQQVPRNGGLPCPTLKEDKTVLCKQTRRITNFLKVTQQTESTVTEARSRLYLYLLAR